MTVAVGVAPAHAPRPELTHQGCCCCWLQRRLDLAVDSYDCCTSPVSVSGLQRRVVLRSSGAGRMKVDDQRALLASLGRRLPSLAIIGRTAIGPAERGTLLDVEGQRPEGCRPLRLWRWGAPDDGGGPITVRRSSWLRRAYCCWADQSG